MDGLYKYISSPKPTPTEVLEAYFLSMERSDKFDPDFVKDQLEAGANPNGIMKNGLNFLSHWFIHHGKDDVVFIGMYGGTKILDLFMKHGADLNSENAEGKSNLMSIVCQWGNCEINKYFVRRGGSLLKARDEDDCGMRQYIFIGPYPDAFDDYRKNDPELSKRENLLKIKKWIETIQERQGKSRTETKFCGDPYYERGRLLHNVNVLLNHIPENG